MKYTSHLVDSRILHDMFIYIYVVSLLFVLNAAIRHPEDVVVLRTWAAPYWLHVVSGSGKDPATRELRSRKLRECHRDCNDCKLVKNGGEMARVRGKIWKNES